jgi:hypothetical protein
MFVPAPAAPAKKEAAQEEDDSLSATAKEFVPGGAGAGDADGVDGGDGSAAAAVKMVRVLSLAAPIEHTCFHSIQQRLAEFMVGVRGCFL